MTKRGVTDDVKENIGTVSDTIKKQENQKKEEGGRLLVQNGADESTRVGRDAMSPVKALAAPMFSASSPLLKTPPKRLTGLTTIVCLVSLGLFLYVSVSGAYGVNVTSLVVHMGLM